MKRIQVFYATLLYAEYPVPVWKLPLHDFPDGVFIYDGGVTKCWYLKDLTPVLIEDVPKELRTMLLLMS